MKKKRATKQKDGYTPAEMRKITHQMIDESAERLRKRLRAAWKEQAERERRAQHEIALQRSS